MAGDMVGRSRINSMLWMAFAVGCVSLALGLILLISRPPQGEPIQLLAPPSPAPILVHVAGAVLNPGVYNLPPGCRVQDAIQAAGGFTELADVQSLNLAAFIEDGSRLVVPQRNPEPLSQPAAAEAQWEYSPSPSDLININTASQELLETLPGIGPVLAAKIIAYRQEIGVFNSIEEIEQVAGIGPSKFNQIKDYITVTNLP